MPRRKRTGASESAPNGGHAFSGRCGGATGEACACWCHGAQHGRRAKRGRYAYAYSPKGAGAKLLSDALAVMREARKAARTWT
jgi:hypothetical protein